MKLKSLLLVGCLSLFGTAFADVHHNHPHADSDPAAQQLIKRATVCEIEIINQSYDRVYVQGYFEDGSNLIPFTIYPYESSHYIDLFYDGYCHSGMYLYVDTYAGYRVYGGYTYGGSLVRIVPYLANKVQFELKRK